MREEIKILKIDSPAYPLSLLKIQDPPKVLYLRGNLEYDFQKSIGIVGTRKFSNYGKEAVFEIARDLARAGFTIISGMAYGIDTFAHQVALENEAKTIAVLGSGIGDKAIYPKSNLKLAKEIIKNNGAVVSEVEPESPGLKYNFPKRNRIIAGLSRAVLVIEAGTRSGALITAQWAFSQNKPVFSLPGSIFWPNSKGCHFLIKKGAKLVENAKDILKELGFSENIPKKELIFKTKEEQIIIDLLRNQSLSIDAIIEKTKIESQKVIALLSLLEAKGVVKSLGAGIFKINL